MESLVMMDFQDLRVTLGLVGILEKMAQRDQRDYLDLSAPLVIEGLLDLLAQEDSKVCQEPRENLVNLVRMAKQDFQVSLV